MNKSDLIIIGCGPGGYRTAEYAARNGLTVTVMEKGHAGGTCLNDGCIPTKTLCRNAELIELFKESETCGIHAHPFDIDFAKMMERKDSVVGRLRGGVEMLMNQPGITYIEGEGRLKNAHTVMACGEEYTAANIIIAMEFASIFNSFGSEVTVIEFLKESLPALDSDIAKRLRQTIAKRGVNFLMQSAVKSIDGNVITFERKGKSETIEADIILIATGRGANIDGLSLDAVGIETYRGGIKTDENMMTNIPGIYAVGDVNGRCMLAHAATAQGIHAVNHILGKGDAIRMDVMPSAIFTLPEAACVGMSEDQCKERQPEDVGKKGFYRAKGKALAMNETEGMIKLMTRQDGIIIGCHAFGAHAADIIQEVSVLMCKETTVYELRDMIHAHPTLGEIIQEISEQF